MKALLDGQVITFPNLGKVALSEHLDIAVECTKISGATGKESLIYLETNLLFQTFLQEIRDMSEEDFTILCMNNTLREDLIKR